MEDVLFDRCKKLHFGVSLVEKALKIQEKPNREFLLELFAAELEERDWKRRNALGKRLNLTF
jgi:hypothetical protein